MIVKYSSENFYPELSYELPIQRKFVISHHMRSTIKSILRKSFLFSLRKKIKLRYVKFKREKYNFRNAPSIKWFGDRWCGFFVDTALLKENSILLSFGVGMDISFDLALHKAGVKKIFLFDPTPSAIAFIGKLKLPVSFTFYPFGLDNIDGNKLMYLPSGNRVSGSIFLNNHLQQENTVQVEMRTLSAIMKMLNISHIDILKIDIEGSEFVVLENILREKIFPVQICLEYHARHFENGSQMVKDSIALLHANGYTHCASTESEEYLFCHTISIGKSAHS